LTDYIMEEVVTRTNLNKAYKKVKANKGVPGIDGMRINHMYKWLLENKESLIKQLLTGEYQPKPVLGVEIPKPGGGKRQLGIPTVIDRLVQQAISQVIERIFDPKFSKFSFGFRPGKSAYMALTQASKYVEEGRTIVVDIDLEKFFDRVNHDILMSRLARTIKDKRLLRIIRRFLEAGIMRQGVCVRRYEGTPQGGPLSPLMSNILLDELDKELEKRKHKFCRYADDCNIYVKSIKAGKRVMQSITNFLNKSLKLKVNQEKSAASNVQERKFLGYTISNEGLLLVAKESAARIKGKLRKITRARGGISLEETAKHVNSLVKGWVQYFRYSTNS